MQNVVWLCVHDDRLRNDRALGNRKSDNNKNNNNNNNNNVSGSKNMRPTNWHILLIKPTYPSEIESLDLSDLMRIHTTARRTYLSLVYLSHRRIGLQRETDATAAGTHDGT